MAVLKVSRQPRFSLAVVAGDTSAVTYIVLGKWSLAVVAAGAGGPRGYPWAF